MDEQVVKRLLALNREFYAHFARDFAETRSAERANVEPIMPYLADGVKVLDVGCGNGRLSERLDREAFRLDYVGIDLTPELVALARARRLHHLAAEFYVADVTQTDWAKMLRGRAPFDLILALAVLHHIPSFELRCAVLRDLRALLQPGSGLIMSNWQFTRSERLKKKIVPWQTLGLEAELEPGDALLDWKRGGTGYRYVHLLTEAEVQSLADQSGFEVVQQFYADGNLNLWSVLKV